jgi:hypothetical protein
MTPFAARAGLDQAGAARRLNYSLPPVGRARVGVAPAFDLEMNSLFSSTV